MLDAKIPSGPLENKWTDYKGHCKLVNPANKRKLEIIVVGTGLAGASAAASLGELGYKVKAFCFQDSRRAHSIAAQGGINAAKNYQNDGDSVFRLFYDTIKGGDYSAREANVHRLAEVSANIIDQCVAQGVPFAREYGGLLSNRSVWWYTSSKNILCCRSNWSAIIIRCLSSIRASSCIRKCNHVQSTRNARCSKLMEKQVVLLQVI
jgi:succinate dehydrogenase/fumarate reductase flavoprotein subunit